MADWRLTEPGGLGLVPALPILAYCVGVKRPPLPIAVASGLVIVDGIVAVLLSTPIIAALAVLVSASVAFNIWRGHPHFLRLPYVFLATSLLALVLRQNPFILLPVVLWIVVALLVSLPEQSRAWFRQPG
jgi:hypothetical protein